MNLSVRRKRIYVLFTRSKYLFEKFQQTNEYFDIFWWIFLTNSRYACVLLCLIDSCAVCAVYIVQMNVCPTKRPTNCYSLFHTLKHAHTHICTEGGGERLNFSLLLMIIITVVYVYYDCYFARLSILVIFMVECSVNSNMHRLATGT